MERKVAIVDVETRWGTSFAMLDRLLKLKEKIQELAIIRNSKLDMLDAHWSQRKSYSMQIVQFT